MTLDSQKCTPCRGGIPPMSEEEALDWLGKIPGWTLNDNYTQISRRFAFPNFCRAMEFAQKIAELAEVEGHHPVLTIGWGYCLAAFQTHKIKGLHENDFIMAAKTSQLFEKPKGFDY